mmetsp:Transcript_6241/g.12974  ORF Transcript_6241/g.12974 Transcript_6241/m.12974 type:complete len:209 (+) Transcript_6241:661-1287(+)
MRLHAEQLRLPFGARGLLARDGCDDVFFRGAPIKGQVVESHGAVTQLGRCERLDRERTDAPRLGAFGAPTCRVEKEEAREIVLRRQLLICLRVVLGGHQGRVVHILTRACTALLATLEYRGPRAVRRTLAPLLARTPRQPASSAALRFVAAAKVRAVAGPACEGVALLRAILQSQLVAAAHPLERHELRGRQGAITSLQNEPSHVGVA